ncbi:MAG: tripartite tricarboxylate transporter substrate binding protein [Betaproteobacteria bacterium]|nr:tripartite tricarboxylate transporter substrate binding protein [Betaproteobacteria bacterium]
MWRALTIAFSIVLFPLLAGAQDYPSRAVRVIVPTPAGSATDMAMRLVAPGLGSVLGQQFVIDNRAGAGGRIGTEVAAQAAADGYTLVLGTPGTLTIMQYVQKNVPYQTLRDFAPIGLISQGPYLLVAHPSVPARNVKGLLALAKAQPGKLNYGSAGTGATNHLAMELFKSMSGAKIIHVPYKGGALATTAILSGEIDLTMLSIGPMLPHVRAGKLRALGITSAKRFALLPDVPAIGESGVPGFEAITWFGLLAPAGTPSAVLARLVDALRKVLGAPEMREKFQARGAEAGGRYGDEFAELIRRETDAFGTLVRKSGMRFN